MKKIYIICFLHLLFISFANNQTKNDFLDKAKPQDFSVAGMTITLTDSFKESNYDGFTQCYESTDVAVFILKEAFSLVHGLEEYTVENYANQILTNNSESTFDLKKEDSFLYFSHIESIDGKDCYYMTTLHQGIDAFWRIAFFAPVTNENKLHDQFIDWAKTVKFNDKVEPRNFSGAGMTITLTDRFKEFNYEGFTQCYDSKDVQVFIRKETFSMIPGLKEYTVENYANLVLTANSRSASDLKNEGGILYFSYIAQGSDGRDYYYMTTLHQGIDAFWMINFATIMTNENKLHDQFIDWAKTVKFNDKVEHRDFSVDDMTITLTENFKESNYTSFTQCYESTDVAVFILKETFSMIPGLKEYTVENYANLVLTANSRSASDLKNEDGILYFSYIAQGSDGRDYYYISTLHQGIDAFWLITFTTLVTNESKLHDQFIDWAKTVKFNNKVGSRNL